MKKLTLQKIRKSILENYLPNDWHKLRKDENEIVFTLSGFFALEIDCFYNEDRDEFYHSDHDIDLFAYDEYRDKYIRQDDSVFAYSSTHNQVITHVDITEDIEGLVCISEELENISTVQQVHNGEYYRAENTRYVESEGEYYHFEDVYFWDSDDEYHLEPEPVEDKNTLWGYSCGPQEKYFVNEDDTGSQKFGWGIEIEKSEFPSFDFNKTELYDRTGAVIERDGSVSNGFELKTPVYNLFSPKTDEKLAELENFCNIQGTQNAGGHIGFSMEGKTDIELLNLCRGFLPLIYAMYRKRVSNSYCQAKKIPSLLRDREKMQSIRLRDSYIEFRIFSAVKSFYTIQFRLQLFRIIANNLGASFSKVLNMATTSGTELNTLLTLKVYNSEDKMSVLINNTLEMQKAFGTYSKPLSEKSLLKIQERIKKQFRDKGK